MAASMVLSYRIHSGNGMTRYDYALKICKRFFFMLAAAIYFKYWGDLPFFFGLAFCILLSGLFTLILPPRALVVVFFVVLLSQSAVMAWLPVPGHAVGDFSRDANAATYLQASVAAAISSTLGLSSQYEWIGLQIAQNLVFPTGIASCIAGLLLGHILLSDLSYQRQAILIAALGCVAMTLATIWDHWCPINKHLWTPSFAVFSAGFASVFLAGFIQMCEVWNRAKIVGVFTWVGRSPLLAVFVFTAAPLIHASERLANIVTPSAIAAEPLVGTVIQLALAIPCFALVQQWLDGRKARACALNFASV